MNDMFKRILIVAIALIVIGYLPMPARADDNTPKSYDGRLDDYNNKSVTLDSSSTGLVYFTWVVLGGVALIVMFKDAKRSHLD